VNKLFEHNQMAYDAVLSMPKETGRGAACFSLDIGLSAFPREEGAPSAYLRCLYSIHISPLG